MSPTFDQAFMYWVGMNVKDFDDAELNEFNKFYSDVHRLEVVERNPGFANGHRYELSCPDPGGNELGPRFLALYEIQDEASANGYIRRNDAPVPTDHGYSAGPQIWQSRDRRTSPWRLIWRQIATSDEPLAYPPEIVQMNGIDPPVGIDEVGLRVFNEFDSGTHMLEVKARMRYSRASRYELSREFSHQPPGCPRFVTIYEGDADAAEAIDAGFNGDPDSQISRGPEVWQQRTAPWRLTYRRIPT